METWWPREEGKFREMEMVGFLAVTCPVAGKQLIDMV